LPNPSWPTIPVFCISSPILCNSPINQGHTQVFLELFTLSLVHFPLIDCALICKITSNNIAPVEWCIEFTKEYMKVEPVGSDSTTVVSHVTVHSIDSIVISNVFNSNGRSLCRDVFS
jgi:hypothetical protein